MGPSWKCPLVAAAAAQSGPKRLICYFSNNSANNYRRAINMVSLPRFSRSGNSFKTFSFSFCHGFCLGGHFESAITEKTKFIYISLIWMNKLDINISKPRFLGSRMLLECIPMTYDDSFGVWRPYWIRHYRVKKVKNILSVREMHIYCFFRSNQSYMSK